MINGIINVKKELGFTSFDVVAKLRKILKIKKIGHTGTLDPNASGVLPVCIGSGTKLVDMITDKDKTYVTTMLLGTVTDTGDITGNILETNEVSLNIKQIIEVINSFVGEYDQIPPMYSAIKINGRKMYELARAGITVDRKARKVNIKKIEILDIALPEVVMKVDCSKGTYIRTLCEDIGKELKVGACVKTLERTRVGGFKLEDSLSLFEIEELFNKDNLEKYVVKPEDVFENLGIIIVNKASDRLLSNGNKLNLDNIDMIEENEVKQYKAYFSDKTFAGIFELIDKEFKPVKMFLS